MIGEMSKVPKLGKNLLILFKIGSVNRYEKSKMEYTNLFEVLRILNATNQLIITLAMTT